jgi:hypothetical protein
MRARGLFGGLFDKPRRRRAGCTCGAGWTRQDVLIDLFFDGLPMEDVAPSAAPKVLLPPAGKVARSAG